MCEVVHQVYVVGCVQSTYCHLVVALLVGWVVACHFSPVDLDHVTVRVFLQHQP